jgi:3-methyladenine DNA glycosylase AlkD
MTTEIIFKDIISYGEKHTNSVLVQKYQRYFKEGYDAYGLNHQQVEEKVKEILALPDMTQESILALSLLLVKSPKYEMTVIAIQLVRSYYKNWTIRTFKTVEKWFSIGITNWAQTDYICGELMNLFFKKGLVGLETISDWRTAENKFQRRAAVVSLIKPMKTSNDFQPFFDFIDPLMMDPVREVHQGLGWFLREAWKKQPGPTELFLLKWKESAARLIFQYATEKMTPEGKQKFRRQK